MNSALLCLAIVLLGVAATLSAPLGSRRGGRGRRPETRDEQRSYLRRFGHWHGPKSNGNGTEEDFRKAVKSLQRLGRLRETGEVDDDTMELMSTPRCGISDDDDTPGRRKRFVIFGTKWPKTVLTYYIRNQTPDLPAGATKSTMARALKYWSGVSPLKFTESETEAANIRIRFASGDHGDDAPFDGPGGVLAHAFYPTEGEVHFDEDETWTQGSSSGTNLLQVATHEFGHSLGLAHSKVPGSVMYPYYRAYNPNFALQSDDISGIQAIYGNAVPTGLPSVSVPVPSFAPGSSISKASTTSTTTRSTIPFGTRPTIRTTTIRTTTTRRNRRRCYFWDYWFGRC